MHFAQMLCRAAQINGKTRALKDGNFEGTWVATEERVARLAGALLSRR